MTGVLKPGASPALAIRRLPPEMLLPVFRPVSLPASLWCTVAARFLVTPGGALGNMRFANRPLFGPVVRLQHLRNRPSFNADARKLAHDVEHSVKLISIGSSLEIVKDIVSAHEVDDHYCVSGFHGTHGLGQVRLVTESAVQPASAHPFPATGFAEAAIVYNAQLPAASGSYRPRSDRAHHRRANDA